MERKTIIAMALAVAVVLVYPHILRIFYPDYGKPPISRERLDSAETSAPALSPKLNKPSEEVFSETRNSEDETEKISKGVYDLVISKKFGSIVGLSFANFKDPVTGESLSFLDAPHGSLGIGAIQLYVDGVLVDASNFKTIVELNRITSTQSDARYEISKEISFSNNSYANDLQLSYRNKTGQAQDIQFRLYAGSGLTQRTQIDPQYFEANWIETEKVKHVKGPGKGKVKEAEEPYIGTSIKNRHFSSILATDEARYYPGARGLEDRHFTAYFLSPTIQVKPDQTWKETFLFFAGINNVESLEPYGLESVVNFGKFDPICKFMLGIMQLVQGVVKNFGVSIIILTIMMNIVLFPLTRAAFMSMRRMQLVQPQMGKLREKYKKDSAKLNKEMMELYKKHKVNPMGGCLPMLFQMPIFIALYVALSKSTDLLGARFLWVGDLATPDHVPLPFHLPLVGDSLHVLPLIMCVLMVVQQKISQAGMPQADPAMAQQQKLMMTVMPIFFGFIFYPMPSGLVLYWLTNTVSTSLIQFMLKRGPIAKA